MKPNLQRLMKQLSRAADALRCADAGEFIPMDDKVSMLHVTAAQTRPQARPVAPMPAPRRRIALVAGKRLGDAALRYALDVCERLDADLDVLAGTELRDAERAVERARRDRPIRCRIHRIGADLLSEVTRYAWSTTGLLFVVAAAGDGLAERAVTREGGRPGIPGQVPWVTVTDERAAA